MKVTIFRRATASLCSALLVGIGLVVGFAPAAQATYNTISATVDCGYEPNSWVIRWSIENSEASKSETITASSNPGVVSVGTVIAPGATLKAQEYVNSPQNRELELTGEWDTGASHTDRGVITEADFPLGCWEVVVTDECSELPGDQPAGFPCTKEPTTRSIERVKESCAIGGIRMWTDVYTTTYTFTDGKWVANPESGAVRENETFTPYTPEELLYLGCETQIVIAPSIEVVDACGEADDSVTLSTSEHYTGVDNGDGTATFSAAAGYAFETASGNVTEVTLTYELPESGLCAATAAAATATPPTCEDDGTLVIADQAVGVNVTPAPGTYGPGNYQVTFTAASGYELANNPSEAYEIAEASDALCADDEGDVAGEVNDAAGSPDLPNTAGNGQPTSVNSNTTSPALPDTGLSSQTSVIAGAGVLALLAGLGLVLLSQARARQGVV